MPITRNLDDLPTPGSSGQASGWAPDTSPRWAQLLAEKWKRENEAESAAHVSSGKRFRASDGGKCARAISYRAAGIEPSDPMDITGHWNVRLGRMLHDAWQEALTEAHPDAATIEVAVDFEPDGTVRIDAVIELEKGKPDDPTEPMVVAYELKSIGGFGFKAAVGKARRGSPAEGPKSEHVLQASLGGLAVNADEVVIGYLAKECISASYGMADLDRFVAEWTLTREQFEPLARKELERVDGILTLVDTGLLASRKVPGIPGEIVDPSTSRWEVRDAEGMIHDTGSAWNGSFCSYCNYVSLCVQTPSGRVPVEQVVEISKRDQA